MNLFAGGGIGRAVIEGVATLCLMPRIGGEFFHHLRLTADYKWISRLPDNYGYWSCTMGIVLGGGHKKKL